MAYPYSTALEKYTNKSMDLSMNLKILNSQVTNDSNVWY